MGSDLAKGAIIITSGVFGMGFAARFVNPRLAAMAWASRRPRTSVFLAKAILVSGAIAGAAVGTAIADRALGASGPAVDVKK